MSYRGSRAVRDIVRLFMLRLNMLRLNMRLFAAVTLCCLSAAMLRGDSTPATALLVLSKGDHALEIVDPATLKIVGQSPSGPDPHEVIASSDGKIAYISNYGGGAYNTLTVVDVQQQKPIPTIDLGALRGPHGLDYEGGKVWFTAEGAKAIGSYDPASGKVDWILGTGQDRTHMIYVFPDLKRMITSNVSSATITIIEKTAARRGGPPPGGGPGGPPPGGPGGPPPGGPGGPPPSPQADWAETVVPVGQGAEGFDVSPDAKELWAANAQDGTISIVDIAAHKVSQTIDPQVKGANRLKFTPDGKRVFVSTLGGADVVVFDVASRKQTKRIHTGRGAAGILMQPDGRRVFVACTPDDYVAVIDLASLEVTGRISVHQPDGLAWAIQP